MVFTVLGNIQYGMPPETIKDTVKIEGGVSEYYIIPKDRFDWKDGINFMEFEFPVYYNFFIKKKLKTKIICDHKTMNDVKAIFQETLLGPRDFSRFHRDFWEGYKAVPDMPKELAHFAVNPFEPTEPLKIEMFIEFLLFDSKDKVEFEKTITVNDIQYKDLLSVGAIDNSSLKKKKYIIN